MPPSTQVTMASAQNVLICDDGLRVLESRGNEEDVKLANERREYYFSHDMQYVARPPHQPDTEHPAFFERRGCFKKASNLNDALALASLFRMLQKAVSPWQTQFPLFVRRALDSYSTGGLDAFQRECVDFDQTALESCRTLLENHRLECLEFGTQGVYVGDIVCFLDNDSDIPLTAVVDTVPFFEDEDLAYVQHFTETNNESASIVTRIRAQSQNFFWGFFVPTRAVYAPPPVLGHNVFIRRSAYEQKPLVNEAENRPWHEGCGADDLVLGFQLLSQGHTALFADLYPPRPRFWRRHP